MALSFFMPFLIGTGGNAGAQTVTTIVRSIALGEIRLGDGWRLAITVAITVRVICTWSTTIGSMIPFTSSGSGLVEARVTDLT